MGAYADLWPREGKSSVKNLLTLELAGVRRAYVYLLPSKDTRGIQDGPIPWKLSAYATPTLQVTQFPPPPPVFSPLTDLSQTLITLTPSVVDIKPLGGSFQCIAAAFLPPLPSCQAINFYFSAGVDVPSGKSHAFAFGDTTDTDFFGLFVAPFGYGPQLVAAPFVPPDPSAPERRRPSR
jgi:hypothetical protein